VLARHGRAARGKARSAAKRCWRCRGYARAFPTEEDFSLLTLQAWRVTRLVEERMKNSALGGAARAGRACRTGMPDTPGTAPQLCFCFSGCAALLYHMQRLSLQHFPPLPYLRSRLETVRRVRALSMLCGCRLGQAISLAAGV